MFNGQFLDEPKLASYLIGFLAPVVRKNLCRESLWVEMPEIGFVQTLESPGILLFRISGLESPGKRHRSWKTLEKSWNSKADALEF